MTRLSPPTRILFLTTHSSYFVSHRMPLARFLRDQGYEVIVAAAADSGVSDIEEEGFRFCNVPFRRQGMNILTELYTLFCIVRLYARERPSLVHHISHKPVIYGAVAAHLTGIRAIVGTVTGLGYAYAGPGLKASIVRFIIEMLYRLYFRDGRTHLIFQNPNDQALFVRKRFISPSRTSLIAGSGVDCEVFVPSTEPEGVPVVVLASRMLRDKGVGEFVEAARQLKARGVSARFILAGAAGDNNPSSIPEAQLLAWTQEGVVDWVGYSRDMPTLFARAHIVCLPSYREGLPLVLAEAAAAGKPVITTDTPGCRDVVQEGVNGFLVPVQDSKILADRMECLLQDAGARQRMGEAGRAFALQQFAVEHIVAQTVDIYQRLGVKVMASESGAS